jgi:hypothetical protein
MGMLKKVHIGLFVEDHITLAHLRALLSLAGYTVSSCVNKGESLRTFLEVIAEQLEQAEPSPYDLLIVDISSAEITISKDILALLVALILPMLPMILLTDASGADFQSIQASFPHVLLLSCSPLCLEDLFRSIADQTRTPLPLSPMFSREVRLVQREQFNLVQREERAWLDRRNVWLDQRQEWLDERRKWLNTRQEWINEHFQCTDSQREWLEEQQDWLEAQYRDVKQQCEWVRHLRLWLDRYRKRLDQLGQQPFSEAQ